MMHGYLNQLLGDRALVRSAGIETHGLNPRAVSIMAEDGIDISDHTSNHVDEFAGIEWDYIITVCDHANENCPYIAAPNALRLHQNFEDPSKQKGTEEETHGAYERTRNAIREYARDFVQQEFGLS
jgi:arsenate reductase